MSGKRKVRLFLRAVAHGIAIGAIVWRGAIALAQPPGNWRFLPELSDEFSGATVDTALWLTFLPHYAGRPPGVIDPARVTVANGMVRLETTARDKGRFATPLLRARQEVRYGYFEVVARLAPCRVNQAFWFYAWQPDGTREIDVFEMAPGTPGEAHRVHSNLHVYDGDPALENDGNRRSYPQVWSAPDFDPTQDNRYGFLWSPTELVWWVNGREIRREPNVHFHWPMALTFTGEIHPRWFGVPTTQELPCAMTIDYVRSWQWLDAADGVGTQPVRDAGRGRLRGGVE
ncbi:MAG: family 16 glycosylhydrolase [Hydrogenophilus thermoluteolus]